MCIFVGLMWELMEQIDIYHDGKEVSRVVVGDGLNLDSGLGDCLKPYGHVFVVVDRQVVTKSRAVYDLVQEFIIKAVPVKAVDVSEVVKTMESVMDICSWLLDKGADRDALVLAVGGGITTDMAGFAATIYKRGVRFAYIPTTLLAQVDAAIGGKTGVNFEKYKNILGVIRQPEFTYLCPQVLESLPAREFLSGAAELLKTFIISDGGMYDRAVAYLKAYSQDRAATLEQKEVELKELITAAAAVKAGVVSRDQFEKGERRVLNLGHTFAHAIQTLSRQSEGDSGMPVLDIRKKDQKSGDITHGEAVAMGMLMAARLAERIGGLEAEKGLADRLEADMRVCGLTVDCPYEVSKMAEVMAQDKKAQGNVVHFVLPLAVGKVTIHDMTVSQACRLLEA